MSSHYERYSYLAHSEEKSYSRSQNLNAFEKYYGRKGLLPHEKMVTLGGKATKPNSELEFLESKGFITSRDQYISVENQIEIHEENLTITGAKWLFGDIVKGVMYALGNGYSIPWINFDSMSYSSTVLPTLLKIISEVLAHQVPGQKCLIAFNVMEHGPREKMHKILENKSGPASPVVFGDPGICELLKSKRLTEEFTYTYKNNKTEMHTFVFGVQSDEVQTPRVKPSNRVYINSDFRLRKLRSTQANNPGSIPTIRKGYVLASLPKVIERDEGAKFILPILDNELVDKESIGLDLIFAMHGDILCEKGLSAKKDIDKAIKKTGYQLCGTIADGFFIRRGKYRKRSAWSDIVRKGAHNDQDEGIKASTLDT